MNTQDRVTLERKSTVALLFFFFFFVITAFWTMKPLRTAGVVKAVGADWYPLVKQGSLFLIPLVMIVYAALTNRLGRARLVSTFTVFFAVAGVFFWAGYQFWPSVGIKIAFFYYVDIYVTVMVALFWTYLNSVASADQAKKYYGIIGSGGLIGGILGASISGWLSQTLGNHIILLSSAFLTGVIFIIAALERGKPEERISSPTSKAAKAGLWESSTEGVRLVWGSRYLMALVGVVGIYEIVSSIVDYQFNASCSAAFADATSMAGFQGKIFSVAQILSLAVMVFLTPWVHRRLGMGAGLVFLPASLLLGSAAFLVVPLLWTITGTMMMDMIFSYSIQQASKEILYVPLDAASKFKAKAFIDMFVFRFAKALGGILTLAYLSWAKPMGLDNRYLMLVSLGFIALWLYSNRLLAGEFKKKTSKSGTPSENAQSSAA